MVEVGPACKLQSKVFTFSYEKRRVNGCDLRNVMHDTRRYMGADKGLERRGVNY